jgi:hypothetical protein
MTHLEELKKSLESMSVEERHAKLRDIRDDRKISKYAETVKKKREQDKGSKMKSKFQAMTPEEQKAFLEMLNESEAGET